MEREDWTDDEGQTRWLTPPRKSTVFCPRPGPKSLKEDLESMMQEWYMSEHQML
jgi:hypothetical protein